MRPYTPLLIALVATVAVFAYARSSWGNESLSCIVKSDVHRVYVGAGCKARVVSIPAGMRVVRR